MSYVIYPSQQNTGDFVSSLPLPVGTARIGPYINWRVLLSASSATRGTCHHQLSRLGDNSLIMTLARPHDQWHMCETSLADPIE